MEAYAELIANVAKTVDQFMSDNITDNQARDYLAAEYPAHFRVDTSERLAELGRRGQAPTRGQAPDFKTDLGLPRGRRRLATTSAEESLVPGGAAQARARTPAAARRRW